jgi:DNA invertase Pin-like site-specific DNA recombinase
MMKRVALYARVSTDGQDTDNQLNELRTVTNRNGWHVVHEFVDRGISGSKGRDKRPAYNALLKVIARREVDIVAAWSVDRLGRSLQHLVSLLNDLHAKGVDLFLHQQGIDTATPSGKAMFQMCGVFAEFERAMIQERVKAGLAKAKAKGAQLGRPRVAEAIEADIKALRQQGTGIKAIAKQLGVGVGTVQRVVNPNARTQQAITQQ